jgi:hypothetical protein
LSPVAATSGLRCHIRQAVPPGQSRRSRRFNDGGGRRERGWTTPPGVTRHQQPSPRFKLHRRDGHARLSTDGSLLSYSCEGWFSLCVANVDGTDERVVADERAVAQTKGSGAVNAGSWSPDGTRIPLYQLYPQDVMILDVATGHSTYVAEGMNPTWLNDHTLIVEISKCYDPEIGGWNPELGCPG